jgi:hypothetical protein
MQLGISIKRAGLMLKRLKVKISEMKISANFIAYPLIIVVAVIFRIFSTH